MKFSEENCAYAASTSATYVCDVRSTATLSCSKITACQSGPNPTLHKILFISKSISIFPKKSIQMTGSQFGSHRFPDNLLLLSFAPNMSISVVLQASAPPPAPEMGSTRVKSNCFQFIVVDAQTATRSSCRALTPTTLTTPTTRL